MTTDHQSPKKTFFQKNLPLLETVFAIGVALLVAMALKSLWLLLGWVLLCPILLLRSPESVAAGKAAFESTLNPCLYPKYKERSLKTFSVHSYLLIAGLLIRIGSTLRYAHKGFRHIPSNWKRVVYEERLTEELRFVPNTSTIRDTFSRLDKTRYGANEFFEIPKVGSITGMVVLFIMLITVSAGLYKVVAFLFSLTGLYYFPNIPTRYEHAFFYVYLFAGITAVFVKYFHLVAMILSYFLAIWYRFSLKATALVWLPLLYIAAESTARGRDVETAICDQKVSALAHLIRVFSWISVALVFWRIALYPNMAAEWNAQHWTTVLAVYISPEKVHPWQWATGLNAVIALASFYFIFDPQARKVARGGHTGTAVRSFYRYYIPTRVVISCYTIIAGLYLTVKGATGWTFAEFSIDFLAFLKGG